MHSQEETRTWRKAEGRRSDREKMQVPKKVGKSRNTAGAEPAGQRKDEKWHAVVARSTFGSKKR